MIHWRKYWIVAQSLGRGHSPYRRYNGAVVYAPENLPTGPDAVVQVIIEAPGEYARSMQVPTKLLAAWHPPVADHEHCYCKREHV